MTESLTRATLNIHSGRRVNTPALSCQHGFAAEKNALVDGSA